MKTPILNLLEKAENLKSLSRNPKCPECSLMANYTAMQLQFLTKKIQDISKAEATKTKNIPSEIIKDMHRSVNISGLYLNV
jgi:hypothetical protein